MGSQFVPSAKPKPRLKCRQPVSDAAAAPSDVIANWMPALEVRLGDSAHALTCSQPHRTVQHGGVTFS